MRADMSGMGNGEVRLNLFLLKTRHAKEREKAGARPDASPFRGAYTSEFCVAGASIRRPRG